MNEEINPVDGAAHYFAAFDVNKKPYVWMRDTDGYETAIESAKTIDIARKKAAKWQKKENETVLKNKKE